LERKDLLVFRSLDQRFGGTEQIYGAIDDWAADKTVDEIVEAGERHGFPAARVMNVADIYQSRHYNERQTVWKFDDPLWDELCYPMALHLGDTPGRIRWSMRPVGFDNEYVLRKILGLSTDEVQSLYDINAIGRWDPKLVFAGPPPDWDGEKGLFFRE
jgi:crotonobetainyl-CoA:carnitine CoA-transferase CaiB-like acyl-CoA transferase